MECQAFGGESREAGRIDFRLRKVCCERKTVKVGMNVSTLKEPYRVEGRNHGLRIVGTVRREIAGCDFVSDRRRRWLNRNVQKRLTKCRRWDGSARSGAHGRGAGGGLRANCESLGGASRLAEFFANASTLASGLRVPGPLGDLMMLRMLRQTKGTALTVSDAEICKRQGTRLAGGIFAAPEGAAPFHRRA